MAQVGYTPIQLYRSNTAAAAPVAGNLNAGELAINYNAADMAIYAKNGTGSVIRIMNNPAGLKYPTADGTSGQVLVTNGFGVLSWSSSPTGVITGAGVLNYVPRFNSTSSVVAGSIFDNGIYVGIGASVVLGSGATDTITLNSQVSANASVGAAGQVLTSRGSGLSPQWATPNATSGTSILYGNGTGGFSNVTVGTGLSFTTGTLANTGVLSITGSAGRVVITGTTTPTIDLASGIITAGTTGSSSVIPVITVDTYGRVTNISTASATQGTVTSVSALTIGTTGTDLTSTVATGTTTPVITLNVPTASSVNRGALSSADWSTFNNKQAALVSGTNIKTVNSNSLLGSGDVSVGTVTSVAALTLGTTGTDLSSTIATGTTTPVITLNVPTASATNRGALRLDNF